VLAFPDAYVSQSTTPPVATPIEYWAIDTSVDQLVASRGTAFQISNTAFSPDGRWVYAMTSDGVYVISTSSNAIVEEIPIGVTRGPVAIVMAPDGSVAYVTDSGDFATSIVNVANGAVVTTVPGMGNIVAISPDGKQIPIQRFAF
jgi:DNA-binding beta-propeller fold protein YncE